jgi:hypothetical protein
MLHDIKVIPFLLFIATVERNFTDTEIGSAHVHCETGCFLIARWFAEDPGEVHFLVLVNDARSVHKR